MPTIAGVPGEGAGVFGSESGMAKPGADTLPLTFAAMRTLAQSGRDILAQLAAASGRTEDDLLRDPRALLQAAAAMATPAALSAAEARLPTPDRGALAGQGAMGETVVAGIESRNAADCGHVPRFGAGYRWRGWWFETLNQCWRSGARGVGFAGGRGAADAGQYGRRGSAGCRRRRWHSRCPRHPATNCRSNSARANDCRA